MTSSDVEKHSTGVVENTSPITDNNGLPKRRAPKDISLSGKATIKPPVTIKYHKSELNP